MKPIDAQAIGKWIKIIKKHFLSFRNFKSKVKKMMNV